MADELLGPHRSHWCARSIASMKKGPKTRQAHEDLVSLD